VKNYLNSVAVMMRSLFLAVMIQKHGVVALMVTNRIAATNVVK
jgi:hypothetical protein